MPSVEITKMDENSVDLFVNKNSLGEMKSDTAKYYIENKLLLKYFHMNHNRIRNVFDDKDKSLISQNILLI